MVGANILESLFDEKLLLILKLFLDNPDEQYYLREISKKTKVPVTTVFRTIGRLKALELIEEKKIKKFKLYSLKKTKSTEFLADVLSSKKSALEEFVETASKLPGLSEIMLHGSEGKDKASLLIIGKGVDQEQIKKLVVDIKSKYNFTIIQLTLELEQYQQMASMGLYSGKRVILYPK